MNIPEALLLRLADEAEAKPEPAGAGHLAALAAKNASGDVLDYFRIYNFYARVDCVELEQADASLEVMRDITPNCEVWQHGFISFARDLEGRAYCFDQNVRDAEGNSRIVRLSYTFGGDTSVEQISAAAELIAPDLVAFLELYLDRKVDSM